MATDKDSILKKQIKKVRGIRRQTMIGEEAGERVLRPLISHDVIFEEHSYLKGNSEYHRCDFIYKQPEDNSPLPLVIYIHGGGWTVGSKEARRGMLSLVAEKGFFVVSINYTLSPEAEQWQVVKETFKATEFAFSKSGSYPIKRGEVFYMGDSAGGHLACLASVCKNNAELAGAVGYEFSEDFDIVAVAPICGVFNFRTVLACKFMFMKKYLWAYSRGNVKGFLKGERSFIESPVNYPCDFPPCFIIMGENDKLIRQSEEMVLALSEKGKDFQIYIGKGKGGFHVFPAMFSTAMAKESIEMLCDFLKNQL